MNMPPYRFRSLESDSHIRVLHLKVEASEQLSGRLVHHDLNENPTYDCLSYVWGCDIKSHNVLLDGSPLPITLNLYNALKRMRQRGSDGEIVIWADGICINQEDIPERNQQVTLMRRIYSECRIGLLYLGEAADESDMVPEFLGTLLKSLLYLSKKTGKPSVFDLQNEFAFPQEYNPGWKRLRALLQRPWFRRVWITQEFAMPVQTQMICGQWELPGTFLATLLIVPMWIFSQAVFISLYAGETRAAIMNHRFHLKMRHAACRDIGIDWNEYFEPSDLLSTRCLQSLVWLLDQSSSSLTTDPRDKIFALIPLSSDPRDTALAVDYSKSKESLAVEVVQHFVRNGYGLSVLLAARPGISSTIPSSWIPDWMDLRTGLEIWPMQYDENSECKIILNPDGKTITVAGVVVDVVEDRGILIGKESIFRENNKWIKDLDNLVDSIDTYPNGQRVEEALWRTLIADRSVENQSPAPKEYGNFYRMARNDHVVFDIYDWDMSAILNAIHHESDFSMAMIRSCRFSITKRRLFSLLPQDAQVDDSIFVVKGDPGKTMFLVRKDPVLNQYRWIGQAYVHGIWDILKLEDLEVHDITVV